MEPLVHEKKHIGPLLNSPIEVFLKVTFGLQYFTFSVHPFEPLIKI